MVSVNGTWSCVLHYVEITGNVKILMCMRYSGTSLVAQMVKNLPAMWEIRVQSLGWEDPLEKGMATHSSILALRILGTEEPGGLQSTGSQRVRQTQCIHSAL